MLVWVCLLHLSFAPLKYKLWLSYGLIHERWRQTTESKISRPILLHSGPLWPPEKKRKTISIWKPRVKGIQWNRLESLHYKKKNPALVLFILNSLKHNIPCGKKRERYHTLYSSYSYSVRGIKAPRKYLKFSCFLCAHGSLPGCWSLKTLTARWWAWFCYMCLHISLMGFFKAFSNGLTLTDPEVWVQWKWIKKLIGTFKKFHSAFTEVEVGTEFSAGVGQVHAQLLPGAAAGRELDCASTRQLQTTHVSSGHI